MYIPHIPHIPLKYKLLPEDKDLWLEGLEVYKKAKASLYKVTPEGEESYCCLGVAAVAILKIQKSTLLTYGFLTTVLSEECKANPTIKNVLDQPIPAELYDYICLLEPRRINQETYTY